MSSSRVVSTVRTMVMFTIGVGILLAGSFFYPQYLASMETAHWNGCMNNMRYIDSAKEQLALAKGIHAVSGKEEKGYVPTKEELLPYMPKDKASWRCPSGFDYEINKIGWNPKCPIHIGFNYCPQSRDLIPCDRFPFGKYGLWLITGYLLLLYGWIWLVQSRSGFHPYILNLCLVVIAVCLPFTAGWIHVANNPGEKSPVVQIKKALAAEGIVPSLIGWGCPCCSESPGLTLTGMNVRSIKALKDMPALEWLDIQDTAVTDISPLRGRQIKWLTIRNSPVADISPVLEIQGLETLTIQNTKVQDVSCLKDLKLHSFRFDPQP